jgi:hypothetical protein
VLLLVPIGLLGPWILQVADNPLLLLTGPGLTVWRDAGVAPWQLALLHPGGPGSYPVLLSAPIVLAGLIAMSAKSSRPADSRLMWVLAVVAVVGLALGMASAHVVVAHIPQDLAGAGGPITGWAGTGLDVAALALVAAALLGLKRGSGGLSQARLSWRRPVVPLVVMAAVLGVVASMGMAGWLGLGETLNRSSSDVPAVAVEQANGPGGARFLALTREGDTIGYRLVGAEPGNVVRDLPVPVVVPDPLLAAAVQSVVGEADVTAPDAARNALADLGVGFVGFHGASTEPLVTQLDATAGMIRLSNSHSQILWRVLPRENTAGPSRLRLVGVQGEPVASIPVTGDHGRTGVDLGPLTPADAGLAGRRLVVAEPQQWAEHARVRFAGHELKAIAGADQPTYLVPPTAGRLSIAIPPSHQRWRWAQLGLLGAVLFLAAPFGAGRTRRSP